MIAGELQDTARDLNGLIPGDDDDRGLAVWLCATDVDALDRWLDGNEVLSGQDIDDGSDADGFSGPRSWTADSASPCDVLPIGCVPVGGDVVLSRAQPELS